MYLKSIELCGFKSFADKTVLSFEPGVTAVVGPNGSGKSNVSDAIRWVMGEMSAKNLRGGKMEDVIFAGTQKRKPVGFAEVTLILDNSDKTFALDFSEVSVTRRVYRSGESEYFINRASCRLRDIHELFMDTGLGRDGYSIISQGKIDEIISNKSEERRGIFDEAAGISKFRHRKEEAERKLMHTQDNLVRIGDIVAELSGQLEPLAAQSEKAKTYLKLREELKVLEVNVALLSIDKNKKSLEEIAEKFEIVTRELTGLQTSCDQLDAEAEELAALAQKLEAEMEAGREELNRSQLSVQSLTGETELIRAGIESNRQMAARLAEDAAKVEERAAHAAEMRGQIEAELGEVRGREAEARSQMAALREESAALEASVAQGNQLLDALKADIIEKMNDISVSKTKTASLETFKQSFLERRGALEAELSGIGGEAGRVAELLEAARDGLTAAQQKTEAKRAARAEQAAALEALSSQAAELAAERNSLSGEYNKKASRLHMLREMEKDYEGFYHSVKSVLGASAKGALGGVHGALSSLLDVSGRYVTAIEVALGGALQNVVVETEHDAKAAIEYLKRQRAGRVTFLPVSSVKGRRIDGLAEIQRQQGFVGVASDLIDYDKKYGGIVESLLGRTVVADGIDNAIAMSRRFGYRFRVVTLEGEVLAAGGAMTGGSMGKSTGLLSRADEIKRLEALSAALDGKLRELEERAQAAQAKQGALAEALAQTDEELAQIERDCVRLQADCEHAEALYGAAEKSRAAILSELEQIELQIHDTNEQIAEMINRTTKDEFDIEAAKAQAAEREAGFGSLTEARAALSERMTAQSVALNSLQKDVVSLELRAAEAAELAASARTEAEAKRAEAAAVEEKNAQLLAQIACKNEQIAAERARTGELSQRLEQMGARRAEAQRQAREKTAAGREQRERVYALKEEQNRVDNRRVKAELELENISARLWEDYEITYTTALEYVRDIGPTGAANRRIGELKGSIRGLGNVNVDAIEEYKSVRERYDFLSAQAEDLTQAKRSLQKLIEEMQQTMKKQFSEQFAIIGKHFSEVFIELFGGGRAGVRLTNPDDVLGSGIEIEAQPPGKKLQSLGLLSGGEKAFCAIALLFAILRVRPAPFCVLDEIEAALDEPNVYRFADYLKQYSSGTQFIIITHRRGTMEAAQLLYGVTMQERGVSKLLALQIDDVENLQGAS